MVNHKTTLSIIRRIPLLDNKAGNMCSPVLVGDMLIIQQKQEYGKRKENQWSISIPKIKTLDILVFGTGLRRPEEMQNHQVYIHDVLGMMDRVDYFDAQQFIRENDTKECLLMEIGFTRNVCNNSQFLDMT